MYSFFIDRIIIKSLITEKKIHSKDTCTLEKFMAVTLSISLKLRVGVIIVSFSNTFQGKATKII